MNTVFLLGRLGQDPQLAYTPSGTPVAKFSLATTEYNKNGNETEWHKIVVYGKTAENCAQYLTKGSQVFVEGKLKTRSWEKDGYKFQMTEIISFKVTFLDPKNTNNKPTQNEIDDFNSPLFPSDVAKQQDYSDIEPSEMDDTPF